MKLVIKAVSVCFGVYLTLFLGGFFHFINFVPISVQYAAIFIQGAMILVFLNFPARKGGPQPNGIPWYDVILLVAISIPLLYVALFFGQVEESWGTGYASTFQTILGIVFIVVLMEAIRRTVGPALVVVVAAFTIHPFICDELPGIFFGRGYSLDRIIMNTFLTGDGALGMPAQIIGTVVVAFVFFGLALQMTGGGDAFLNLAFSLLGGIRGGPAKGAVVSSALFGSISGSTVANVVTTGSVTIPMMKRIGFKPEFAAAVETVASNGGMILPPVMGAVAFLMSQITGISYIEICAYALIPALIYYFCLLVLVDLYSAKLGIKGLPKKEIPPLKQSLVAGLIYFVPFGILVYLLAALHYSPTKSALWSLVVLLIVTSLRKSTRIKFKDIGVFYQKALLSVAMVAPAAAGAGIIIGSMSLTGIGIRFSTSIIDISGGNLVILLLLTAIACFIIGMVGSGIAAYLMLAVLIAPTLVEMGVPVVAAHLFVVYWSITAYISPPVAIGVYAASSIADSDIWRTSLWAVALGSPTFLLPFVFVFDPSLLTIGGSAGDTALVAITSFAGIVSFGAGTIGYIFRPMNLLQRILGIVGGLLLLVPDLTTDAIGAILILILVVWQLRQRNSSNSKIQKSLP